MAYYDADGYEVFDMSGGLHAVISDGDLAEMDALLDAATEEKVEKPLRREATQNRARAPEFSVFRLCLFLLLFMITGVAGEILKMRIRQGRATGGRFTRFPPTSPPTSRRTGCVGTCTHWRLPYTWGWEQPRFPTA
jgi:hypothetical protein